MRTFTTFVMSLAILGAALTVVNAKPRMCIYSHIKHDKICVNN